MKRSSFLWIAYAVLLGSLTTFAQPDTVWTRTYAIDAYPRVLEVADGGRLAILSEDPEYGLRVLKLSADGDSLWCRVYFESGYYVIGATKLTDGNIVVLADTVTGNDGRSDTPDRLFLLNPDGEVILSQWGIDSVNFRTISATPDGGATVVGVDRRGESDDLIVRKMNEDLVAQWTTALGDSVLDERVWGADTDEEGRIFFVGASRLQTGGAYHPLVALIGQTGEPLWTNRFENLSDTVAFLWECQAIGGEYWVMGDFDLNPWVVKYDLNGDSIWSRIIRPTAQFSILTLDDFDIVDGYDAIIAGDLYTPGHYSPVLYRMTRQGDISWNSGQPSGSAAIGGSWSIVTLSDNGYLVSGSFIPNQGLQFTRFAPDVVSVSPSGELPWSEKLHPNHPNPFNATTEISFDLPRAMNASLRVYDVLGRAAAQLVNSTLNAGTHTVSFDAAGLASGVYFYRLETDNFVATRKMVLLK